MKKILFGIIFWSTVFTGVQAVEGEIDVSTSQDTGRLTLTSEGGDLNIDSTGAKYVFLGSDIMIPVMISAGEVNISSRSHGSFTFSSGKLTSAVQVPTLSYADTPANNARSYSARPTLFISIGGYRGQADPTRDGSGIDGWINNVNSLIFSRSAATAANDYQKVHFQVNWESANSNILQVKELAKVIRNYINAKTHAWDVVLMGHSRGGVFAHELTKKLVDLEKINSLHSFLIDPTSSTFFGDYYPVRKHNGSIQHFGSLIYDAVDFVGVNFSTQGDVKISGYNNYGRNDHLISGSSHSGIINEYWINTGLNLALNDVATNKDLGTYSIDGLERVEEIVIEIDKDIYFYGEASFDGDNVEVVAEVGVGPINGNMHAMVGKDGVEIGSSIMLASTNITIRAGQAKVQETLGSANYAAEFGTDGILIGADAYGVGGGAVLNKDELGVSTNIGNLDSGVYIGDGDVEVTIYGVQVSAQDTIDAVFKDPLKSLPKIRCCKF
jgi:hypothetical protein